MGISEIEALALILGGAFLVGFKAPDRLAEFDGMGIVRLVLVLGGLAMLVFGLLDVARDHL